MRTRTLLTTPPGRRPQPVAGPRNGSADTHEDYAPALARPSEPVPPSRLARPVLILAVAVLLVAFGLLVTRVVAPAQDPSVPGDSRPTPQATP